LPRRLEGLYASAVFLFRAQSDLQVRARPSGGSAITTPVPNSFSCRRLSTCSDVAKPFFLACGWRVTGLPHVRQKIKLARIQLLVEAIAALSENFGMAEQFLGDGLPGLFRIGGLLGLELERGMRGQRVPMALDYVGQAVNISGANKRSRGSEHFMILWGG
jgi:hypothetical protein